MGTDDNMSRSARRSKTADKKETTEKDSSKSSGGKKNKKEKQKKTAGGIALRIFLGLVLLGCIAFLSGVGLFWHYAKNAEDLSDDRLDATVSSKLYAGDVLLEDIGTEKREKVTPNEVPQLLEDAIVSVEDRRFYKHVGVDPIRILGSLFSNVTTGGKQGGSTLTQQLIKLSYFSTSVEDQTLERKAQEALMAVRLEKEKSKQEILTYYVNKVYMANGIYGMGTAAQTYFGKELSELTLPQTALLAGMPQAPNDYDPYEYPELAKERRDVVLYTMLDNNKISEAEYDEAINTPVDEGLIDLKNTSSNWKLIDGYITEVAAEVEEKTGKNIYTDGLEIYTNLDIDAQQKLYDIVNTDEYVDYPDDEMQAAVTMIDVNTGQVKAQIGGRHFPEDSASNQNFAVNTMRDFGSTMKPLTDYGPAFEYLNYSTGTTIIDEPYKYVGTDTSVYNWDRSYKGTMTLRQALYLSRNIPAVKLFNEVGSEDVAKFLKGLGIEYGEIEQANAISSNSSSIEAGSTKYGVSSLKSAAAYAAFANGGTYYEPQYVNRIVYQDGTEETFESAGERAMSEGTAYMITDILKDVMTVGIGYEANVPGLHHAGKTGTSNYTDEEISNIEGSDYTSVYPDLLFTGYSPYYAVSVWTGYKDRDTPLTEAYSSVAMDIYREFMQYISASVENIDWEMPDDLVRIGNELYFKDVYTPQTLPGASSHDYTEPSSTPSSSSETPASSTLPSSSEVIPEPSSEITEPSSEPPTAESNAPGDGAGGGDGDGGNDNAEAGNDDKNNTGGTSEINGT